MDLTTAENDTILIENYIKLMWGEFNKIRSEYQLAPLLLAFSLIDANSKLCTPDEEWGVKQRFTWWIETYLTGCPEPYTPIDLYGARCGLLHEYGAESDLSRTNKCRVVIWTIGDRLHHGKNKDRILLLSQEQFFEDLNNAGLKVIKQLQTDLEFQKRFASRLKNLFGVRSFKK